MSIVLNHEIFKNIDVGAFAAGCRAELEKTATLAHTVGKALNWLAPDTTKNFIAPAWHGVQKYTSSQPISNWTADGVINSGLKGIEGNRTQGLVNQANQYGVSLNTDQYGALKPGNPINIGNTDWLKGIKTIGGNAIDWLKNDGLQWVKDNPWKLAGGGLAAYGGLSILRNLFGLGGNEEQQTPTVVNNYSGRFNPEYAPSSMAKYGGFEASPLLGAAMRLPYAVAGNMASPTQGLQTATPQLPPKPNIRTEDPRLNKLLQDPRMRDYLEDLLADQ